MTENFHVHDLRLDAELRLLESQAVAERATGLAVGADGRFVIGTIESRVYTTVCE
ncbi:MAG: hypothetical protein AB8I08_30325 [Sandaracinaceae bacterium]